MPPDTPVQITANAGEFEDDDEDQVEFAHIQSFADKIQHVPGQSRTHIVIPKRGEKDFEPLEETVNLQEMMLNKSREALFGALQGVRGGGSKTMSHALFSPTSAYPYIVIAKGHLLDSMGISVRQEGKGKARARTELLPEEALFLLERGSLQIWVGPEDGEWSDEECGFTGAIEMSVSEGFGAFLKRDDLTWERYQAYAYLKRLGYTVQRTGRFLPTYFGVPERKDDRFRTWWLSIPSYLSRLVASIYSTLARLWGNPNATLLSTWRGVDYGRFAHFTADAASVFRHLRIIPSSHDLPLPMRSTENPYLPFYHIWKPAVPWSKSKWDRGSQLGLARQPPDFQVAAINARVHPLPTIQQLHEIFEESPNEHRGSVQRHGPQYRPVGTGRTNPIAELRNGDRAFIVAVNDSGNAGWVRFGRSGFAGLAMI